MNSSQHKGTDSSEPSSGQTPWFTNQPSETMTPVINPLHKLDQTLMKLNIHEDTEEYFANQSKKHGMKKVLRWPELILLGVGATIGAGIFVVTGIVARDKTGPALPLSYIFSGIACLLSAFSYAEFAGMAPTAGSEYGYTRSTMGEFFGWMIGWDLVLEYAVSAAGVAQGFSSYLSSLLAIYGYSIPTVIASTPWGFDPETGKLTTTGSYFDVIALVVTFLATLLLIRGIKETATLNAIMVMFKIGVCLFVILVGAFFVNMDNFKPFMPYGFAGISFFGYTAVGQSDAQGNSVGVLAGASVVFFAYIGFDAVTTNAEECERPQRDLPIGLCVGWVSALIPLSVLVELVSMGTLMAFMFVNISILVLRVRSPHLPRPFACPGYPYVPALGALCCLTLMLSLPSSNWIRLVVWFVLGLCIYYGYGRKNAELMRRGAGGAGREGRIEGGREGNGVDVDDGEMEEKKDEGNIEFVTIDLDTSTK